MKSVLQDLGLNIKSMVGQCYDGTTCMSGVQKGVAARMQEIVPEAVYVHCCAHRLNLTLQDTLEANIVLKNALGVVQSLHHFFHSPKREAILNSLNANNHKFGKYIKLKSSCATRWTCRLEAVKSVLCQILRILLALKQCSMKKIQKPVLMPLVYLLLFVTSSSFWD